MSRSFRKIPICTDNANSGEAKRMASRLCRRYLNRTGFCFPKGNGYKLLYSSYDICDYKFSLDRSEHLPVIQRGKRKFLIVKGRRYKSLKPYYAK